MIQLSKKVKATVLHCAEFAVIVAAAYLISVAFEVTDEVKVWIMGVVLAAFTKLFREFGVDYVNGQKQQDL